MATLRSMADEPGTKREYETIFILRPDTANDAIATINTRIRGVIEAMEGNLLKLDNWGKRKLAYEVKKQLKGVYLYWRYLGPSSLVEELERNLRMMDAVIRYYTVQVNIDVDPNARPSEVTEESFAAAATPGPDEEEIATGAAARPFDDDEFADDYFEEEAPAPAVVEEPAAATPEKAE